MSRHSLALVATLVVAALAPRIANAAWPPEGVDLLESYGTSQGNYTTRLEHDGAGGVIALWWGQGGSATLREARVQSDGTLYHNWGISGIESTVDLNRATSDELGGVIEAYVYNGDVWLWRVLPTGGDDPLWSPTYGVNVSGTPATNEFFGGVTGDGAGGAYVAYNSPAVVKHVLTNASLDPAWPASGALLGSYIPVALRSDGEGGILVFGSSDQCRMFRLTSSGARATGWPSAGLVVGPASDKFIEIVPSGPDHFLVAWPVLSGGLRLQRFHRGGTIAAGWPAAGLSIVPSGGTPERPSAVSDGGTGIYLAWQSGSAVRGVRVLEDASIAPGWSAGGQSLLDAGAVTVSAYPAPIYSVARGPAGGLIVGWPDQRNPGPTTARARWLLADGTADPALPDTGIVVNPPDRVGQTRAVLDDGAGGAFVAWADETLAGSYWHLMQLSWVPYPVALDVPAGTAPASLRLARAWPNPASHRLDARLTLAGDDPARLDLLDVSGRRVREQIVSGAGEHAIAFDHLDALPAGAYLMRLVCGAESRVARVAIVH